MRSKKFFIGLVIFIGVIVVLFFGFSAKVYPVAIVNDQMISAKALDQTQSASYNYFSKVIAPEEIEKLGEKKFSQEVRRATLDTLIEVVLVEQELGRIFEPEAMQQEALRRVNNTTTTEQTDEATRKIMGISLEEFKQLVLLPEARREILEEELAKTGKTYEQWLDQARLAAGVSLFLTDFVWQRSELCPNFCVEINEQPGLLDTLKEILPSSSTLQNVAPPASTTPEQLTPGTVPTQN